MSYLKESIEVEIDMLRNRVAELERELAEADVETLSARLEERIKELSTLYRESYLADQPLVTLDEYLVELVALLPPGWQFAGDACARILVSGQTYATHNFSDTPWQQSSTISVQGKEIGTVTVGYLSPHPDEDEGPFLKEERSLLGEIAKRIGQFIERRQAEMAHQFLAAIVESSDDAIISMTLDGVIQTWNKAAERIYGYGMREVVGKSIATILDSVQYGEMARLLQRIRDGYDTGQFDTVRRRKNGQEVHISLSLSPIYDERGRPVGAAAIARDITDRRLFEATMRESDERLRYTFEQAAVGLAHLGVDGRFLRVNQKLSAILGYTAAELPSMTIQQITYADDLDEESALIQNVLEGRRPTYNIETRNFRKDGTIVWVNRTVSLARDHAGQPKYFIVVVEDITQRKEAERARIESENRYRGLFENSPVSLWEQDFSGVKRALARLQHEGITDYRAYFESHPDFVSECLQKVRLLSFNRASLELYGASSREELLASLDRFVPAEGRPMFIEELIWIARGLTAFAWQGVNRKLSGERIYIRLHWTAAPGHEETLDRVLVSIEDITDSRAAAIAAAK